MNGFHYCVAAFWMLLAGMAGAHESSASLAVLLKDAIARGGGSVFIPAGDYALDGEQPLPLASNMVVFAYGARFHLPEKLNDGARRVCFSGRDLEHFAWFGGEFFGHVFDPAQRENAWPPNASTRVFVLTTSATGQTRDIVFRDVRADGIAGAVINVEGVARQGSESEIVRFAESIVVEDCTLLRSGKFMWDYGYLWQQLVWPEAYEPWEVERARKYFRNDLVRANVQMTDGGERVRFDNSKRPIPLSPNAEPHTALCFYGGALPRNIARGRQYFVVDSNTEGIQISEQPRGAPIRFEGSSGPGAQLVHDLFHAYLALYAPNGAGPGKGGLDLQCCRTVRVAGCQLSALGDTMHIQRCHDVIFKDNRIVGSRMGAFFLAEYCKNAEITGNFVDGTNGSRVMSIEKSSENVTVTGNTFCNGGRGSWINQPRNFVLRSNTFLNNTTKGESDPRRGRRSYETGEYLRFPELYFTLHQEHGAYGPAVIRDNVFELGPGAADAAVTFAPNGSGLQFIGNVFRGRETLVRVDPSCKTIEFSGNTGARLIREPVGFQHGKR